MRRRASLAILSVLAGLAFSLSPAAAQTVDTTQAVKGAKTPQNVDIEADSMEIHDQEKKAVFKGNVNAVRADVTLKCDTLTVTYTETAAAAPAKKDTVAQTGADTGAQAATGDSALPASDKGTVDTGGGKKTEVTFLDAEGNVVIITTKQTVTGKTAHMDVKANKLWVKGG